MNFFKPTKVSMMIFCFILFLSLRALLDWTCTEYYRVSPEHSNVVVKAIIPVIFPDNPKNSVGLTYYNPCSPFANTQLLSDVLMIADTIWIIIVLPGYIITLILSIALPMFYSSDQKDLLTPLGVSTLGIISLVLWYFLSCLASSLWYKLKERNVSRQNPP